MNKNDIDLTEFVEEFNRMKLGKMVFVKDKPVITHLKKKIKRKEFIKINDFMKQWQNKIS